MIGHPEQGEGPVETSKEKQRWECFCVCGFCVAETMHVLDNPGGGKVKKNTRSRQSVDRPGVLDGRGTGQTALQQEKNDSDVQKPGGA